MGGAMAIPAAGAAIGAMMDKEKPLRGATMGGLGGYFLAPAMAAGAGGSALSGAGGAAAGGGTAAGGSSMASIMPAMTNNPVNLANSAQLMSGAANPAMAGAAAPASGMFGNPMQMGMLGMGLLGGGKEQPQQQNQVSSMPRQPMQARPFSGMTQQAQPQLPQVQGMAGRFPYM